MMIRAYLRASTTDQDAQRARESLDTFAREQGHPVASWYAENRSGATTDRPELRRLLSDALPGDVLLVESIDRLSRLPGDAWRTLRTEIEAKGLRVVALDLPTSHVAMTAREGDEFTGRMLDAVNGMMLDMMAAIARKDYEQRRQRQAQGIAKAKAAGKYKGRPPNKGLRDTISKALAGGLGVREIARVLNCSPATVSSVKKEMERERAESRNMDMLQ